MYFPLIQLVPEKWRCVPFGLRYIAFAVSSWQAGPYLRQVKAKSICHNSADLWWVLLSCCGLVWVPHNNPVCGVHQLEQPSTAGSHLPAAAPSAPGETGGHPSPSHSLQRSYHLKKDRGEWQPITGVTEKWVIHFHVWMFSPINVNNMITYSNLRQVAVSSMVDVYNNGKWELQQSWFVQQNKRLI